MRKRSISDGELDDKRHEDRPGRRSSKSVGHRTPTSQDSDSDLDSPRYQAAKSKSKEFAWGKATTLPSVARGTAKDGVTTSRDFIENMENTVRRAFSGRAGKNAHSGDNTNRQGGWKKQQMSSSSTAPKTAPNPSQMEPKSPKDSCKQTAKPLKPQNSTSASRNRSPNSSCFQSDSDSDSDWLRDQDYPLATVATSPAAPQRSNQNDRLPELARRLSRTPSSSSITSSRRWSENSSSDGESLLNYMPVGTIAEEPSRQKAVRGPRRHRLRSISDSELHTNMGQEAIMSRSNTRHPSHGPSGPKKEKKETEVVTPQLDERSLKFMSKLTKSGLSSLGVSRSTKNQYYVKNGVEFGKVKSNPTVDFGKAKSNPANQFKGNVDFGKVKSNPSSGYETQFGRVRSNPMPGARGAGAKLEKLPQAAARTHTGSSARPHTGNSSGTASHAASGSGFDVDVPLFGARGTPIGGDDSRSSTPLRAGSRALDSGTIGELHTPSSSHDQYSRGSNRGSRTASVSSNNSGGLRDLQKSFEVFGTFSAFSAGPDPYNIPYNEDPYNEDPYDDPYNEDPYNAPAESCGADPYNAGPSDNTSLSSVSVPSANRAQDPVPEVGGEGDHGHRAKYDEDHHLHGRFASFAANKDIQSLRDDVLRHTQLTLQLEAEKQQLEQRVARVELEQLGQRLDGLKQQESLDAIGKAVKRASPESCDFKSDNASLTGETTSYRGTSCSVLSD